MEMLQQITKLKCVQVVLLLSNPDDIPEMITHVLPVKQRKCLPVYSREEFLKQTDLIAVFIPIRRKGRFRSERGVFTSGRGTERTFRSSRYFQDGTCFDQVW